MRNKLLTIFGVITLLSAPVFAQEEATDTDTFESLIQEHKDYITTDRAEDKTYWEDYRSRWQSTIDNCKSTSLSPSDCNAQYLSTLRQEAIDRVKSERAERIEQNKEFRQGLRDEAAERREALKDAYLQRLEERQARVAAYREAHPYTNPAVRADRREDVRDRREDVRDRKEDVQDRKEDVRDRREDRYDATHNAPPGTKAAKKDKLEDVRDRREDVRDTREDKRDKREDVQDRHENRVDRHTTGATGNRGYMKSGSRKK